jgi:hypothetical protein
MFKNNRLYARCEECHERGKKKKPKTK